MTGSEADVCVLAVILVRNAVCSSSDEGHDALISIYHRRYGEQIEVAEADAVLARWR